MIFTPSEGVREFQYSGDLLTALKRFGEVVGGYPILYRPSKTVYFVSNYFADVDSGEYYDTYPSGSEISLETGDLADAYLEGYINAPVRFEEVTETKQYPVQNWKSLGGAYEGSLPNDVTYYFEGEVTLDQPMKVSEIRQTFTRAIVFGSSVPVDFLISLVWVFGPDYSTDVGFPFIWIVPTVPIDQMENETVDSFKVVHRITRYVFDAENYHQVEEELLNKLENEFYFVVSTSKKAPVYIKYSAGNSDAPAFTSHLPMSTFAASALQNLLVQIRGPKIVVKFPSLTILYPGQSVGIADMHGRVRSVSYKGGFFEIEAIFSTSVAAKQLSASKGLARLIHDTTDTAKGGTIIGEEDNGATVVIQLGPRRERRIKGISGAEGNYGYVDAMSPNPLWTARPVKKNYSEEEG